MNIFNIIRLPWNQFRCFRVKICFVIRIVTYKDVHNNQLLNTTRLTKMRDHFTIVDSETIYVGNVFCPFFSTGSPWEIYEWEVADNRKSLVAHFRCESADRMWSSSGSIIRCLTTCVLINDKVSGKVLKSQGFPWLIAHKINKQPNLQHTIYNTNKKATDFGQVYFKRIRQRFIFHRDNWF